MKNICVGCGDEILSGQVITYSGIYGATEEMILCPICAKHEEEEIDRKGTNNLPNLLLDFQLELQSRIQHEQEETKI